MCVEQCCSWLLPVLAILGKQSPGEIHDPPRVFGDVPWAETLGLAGKSPLAECASVQLEALCGWKWWCRGGSWCPPPLAPGLCLARKCIMPRC